ncbi:hypothetical protein [Frankia sp. AgB32]|uniref:hypothetical protein n=1 Tax=Frankia sp. AgB32 TaxID=631119 RepID=UPI00200FA03A|nr:hypothetical protein [Frankia sp. AgB32]MCK9897832.1 hypothetical protein [Frankia sp. AgB32]
MDVKSHDTFEDFVTASADRLMRTANLLTGGRHAADDGLAYVQNGQVYRTITQRFVARYPGVIGNLGVNIKKITLLGSDSASVDMVITHHDPTFGARWGHTIPESGNAVRVGVAGWSVAPPTASWSAPPDRRPA